MKTSVVEPVKSGSIWEKITATRPTSMTFSRVPVERIASYRIRQAACSSGSSISSGSGSGRNFHDQSGGHSRGRTSFWKASARPSSTTISSPMIHRCAADLVGDVELRDVQPVLLWQLHDHPDQRGRAQPPADQQVHGLPARADRLVGDEEVLEDVREDQQQPPGVGELEGQRPDQPVEVEEPADAERRHALPVAQGREVGHGQVEDVHRLVVALVVGGSCPKAWKIVWSTPSRIRQATIAGSG